MTKKKKVVLIRLDKIGDLICSLPADQILDPALYDVTWIVQKGLGAVVELGALRRKYFELDKAHPALARAQLKEILASLAPDIAISFQCPWWVNFELFRAGVPVRSGVKSQWHSFLFLNNGIRQKRSLAEKHELDYNLDLLRETLQIPQTKEYLYFEISQPEMADSILKLHNLKEKNYVVIHPGMMGSALNWPQSQYIECIEYLISRNKIIVITGTDADENYLTEIKQKLSTHPNVRWLQSKLDLPQLVSVLSRAEYVVAPSTGVAHLAAGVGASVKGIYSPVQVHHPRRWAPRGPHVEIFMLPHVDYRCF